MTLISTEARAKLERFALHLSSAVDAPWVKRDTMELNINKVDLAENVLTPVDLCLNSYDDKAHAGHRMLRVIPLY